MADINLFRGDCLSVMKKLPKVDLVFSDPPYGTTQCKWDSIINLVELWECLNLVRRPETPIVIFGMEPFSSLLRCSNIKEFKYDWIWEKSKATGFLNSKRQPLRAHEVLSVFYKKQPMYNPQMKMGEAYNKGVRKPQTVGDVYGDYKEVLVKSQGLRYPRSVLYHKTAESEGKTYHKTQKPIALLEEIIQTYTNPGDHVLDFAMGSGSTGVACKNTGRRFTGIEIDRDVFSIAVDRIHE